MPGMGRWRFSYLENKELSSLWSFCTSTKNNGAAGQKDRSSEDETEYVGLLPFNFSVTLNPIFC